MPLTSIITGDSSLAKDGDEMNETKVGTSRFSTFLRMLLLLVLQLISLSVDDGAVGGNTVSF